MKKSYCLLIVTFFLFSNAFSQDIVQLNSKRKFTVAGQQFSVKSAMPKLFADYPDAQKEFENFKGIKTAKNIIGVGGGILIFAGFATQTAGAVEGVGEGISQSFGEGLAAFFADESEPVDPLTRAKNTNRRASQSKADKKIQKGKNMTRIGLGMFAGSLLMNFLEMDKLKNAVGIYNSHQKSKLSSDFQKIKPDNFNFNYNPSNQTMQLQLIWTIGK